eukprot:Sdes_comp16026_c0_seq1m5210
MLKFMPFKSLIFPPTTLFSSSSFTSPLKYFPQRSALPSFRSYCSESSSSTPKEPSKESSASKPDPLNVYKDVIRNLSLSSRLKDTGEYKITPTPKKRCPICSNAITEIDYKNVRLLSQFVTDNSGRIIPRKSTGVCAKFQREIRKCIKRARHAGIMPNIYKIPEYKFDPKLNN